MASTNFYLDKKTSEKPTFVFLSISDQGKRYRISTGEKIEPKFWNDRKQIAKKTYIGSLELNAFLNQFADTALNLLREAKTEKRVLNNAQLKERLKAVYAPQETVEDGSFDFWPCWKHFIEDSKNKGRAKGTIRTYNTLESRLRRFQESTGYYLTFETLDGRFQSAFHDFLVNDLSLEHSTILKTFKILKRYLNYAWRLGHLENTDYQRWETEKAIPKEPISLRLEELEQFARYDFSQKPRLEKVRDMFIFQCETGMRVGDLLKLRSANVIQYKGHTMLDFKTEKTGDHIEAPIDTERFPYSVSILDKYKSESRTLCFPSISQQKYRDYLKEAAEAAGLSRITTSTKTIKGKTQANEKPLYKVIATHTARRTFISLSHEAGMPISWIMLYTGQKSYDILVKYLEMHKDHKLRLALNPIPDNGIKTKMDKVG